jgi:hypothetical protein
MSAHAKHLGVESKQLGLLHFFEAQEPHKSNAHPKPLPFKKTPQT